jgi:2-polyprenyl-6-hydroxyphenyl methylase/3-demethylubiquinone-9 3-methyltransferase
VSQHQNEVLEGERFRFGENWSRFLEVLNEDRIDEAVLSLKQMLGVEDLIGKSFLDLGSGSGLFSLAAKRLGATVVSIDFDPQSVECTKELKRRYFSHDQAWIIKEASVLDIDFIHSLEPFDIVYSWGVLHHTGNMWQALENVVSLVKQRGRLFISIYNDQGNKSKRWRFLKKKYNSTPLLRPALIVLTLVVTKGYSFIKDTLKGDPLKSWKEYKKSRGMSAWHDVIDWIGGYPFEVAKPEEIFQFYRTRGFELEALTTSNGLGCNQYVFIKTH